MWNAECEMPNLGFRFGILHLAFRIDTRFHVLLWRIIPISQQITAQTRR